MEKRFDKNIHPGEVTATALQTESTKYLSEAGKHHQCASSGDKAGMDKFPSANDLLGELNKDAQVARGKHPGAREQGVLSDNVYHLQRDLKKLTPADLKVVADTAKTIQNEKAQGKPIDVAKHLKELEQMFKSDKFPTDKASLIWNATMLELGRENHSNVELINHSRRSEATVNMPDPFTHVLLTDHIP